MAERPRGFEYKHVECPQDSAVVDRVMNDHAMFWWEMMNTQTVVSKESHLEQGEFNPDNLYSVTTTERFVAIDLRRATDTPDLQRVRQVETRYFQVCVALNNLGGSPMDNYSMTLASFSAEAPSIVGAMLCYLDPRFYLWVLTFGVWRDREKVQNPPSFLSLWINPLSGTSLYVQLKKGQLEEARTRFSSLKSELEGILEDNVNILNIT